MTLVVTCPLKKLTSLFPSPQKWGEGDRRADEGLLMRSALLLFAQLG